MTTTIEVIVEVVYVLQKVYSTPKAVIDEAMTVFLSEITVKDKEVLLCAIHTFSERNLDFVDCIL